MRSRSLGSSSWPKSHGVSRSDHGTPRLLVGADQHAPALLAHVDLALEVDRRAASPSADAATSGISSVMRYWCSIASIGSSRPTMRPTSRAHRPPALTTCSAWMVPLSVTTSHDAVGARREVGDARVAVDLGALPLRAAWHRRAVTPARIDMAFERVVERADEMPFVHQREEFARPRRPRPCRVPCRDSGRARMTIFSQSMRSGVPASIDAAGDVHAAGLARDVLDLLVELDRVLLQLGDVGIAVDRVHAARGVPGRARGQLARARSARRRSSPPWSGDRARWRRRRRRRSPRPGHGISWRVGFMGWVLQSCCSEYLIQEGARALLLRIAEEALRAAHLRR